MIASIVEKKCHRQEVLTIFQKITSKHLGTYDNFQFSQTCRVYRPDTGGCNASEINRILKIMRQHHPAL